MTSSASPMSSPSFTSGDTLGLFESQTDVGTLSRPGSCAYDAEQQTYTIEGSGQNIWGDHDGFHFVWKRMTGNFILYTRARFLNEGGEPHRKLGWMIRSSLDTASPNLNTGIHGDGLTTIQFRRTAGGPTEDIRFDTSNVDVIQLERQGNTHIMSVARFGEPFVTKQFADIELGDEVYVGLYVCSHNDDLSDQVLYRDVRIIVPAPEDVAPQRDSLGSHLEILDVEQGHRQIIYSSAEPFEAPNWTPDGKALIYNSAGRLYRFDLAEKRPELIDTGFATRNNNDHVLSFDGTMLGISHHSADDQNQSIVYTLPVTGGTPKRIASQGPSYLHGWSPDGTFLAYTGERNGHFDIYTMSVDGGEETQLTTAQGLDDGSEYTPDGQYIYFNSVRSGTMQIWRMKPDGGEQEQVTDDEFNNWFPHVSPDGQQFVVLSYTQEVEPGAHPPYKRVYLRRLPIAGGPPKVVAYVYGGQGTINVPSWSPDSKYVAFVSNTAMR